MHAFVQVNSHGVGIVACNDDAAVTLNCDLCETVVPVVQGQGQGQVAEVVVEAEVGRVAGLRDENEAARSAQLQRMRSGHQLGSSRGHVQHQVTWRERKAMSVTECSVFDGIRENLVCWRLKMTQTFQFTFDIWEFLTKLSSSSNPV